MYDRLLRIQLPKRQSAFLWGARKTGKSTFLKKHFQGVPYYDLLKSDLFLLLLKEPHIFREEVLALEPKDQLIIVDEIQKIPILLDEVHWLIENTQFQFILCGSSARKLKQTGVNMLGGRAWKYAFFPLVYPEIPEYPLLEIFHTGTIPSHFRNPHYKKALKSYLEDYITLEIQAEGLVRNLPAFARFLDCLRFSHGEMLNYSNIAREASVDQKTIKSYFQILEDTLMGYFVYPYRKRISREIITDSPKFYLFDVGLANAIKKVDIIDLKGAEAGKSLEQLILLELTAYRGLYEKDFAIQYWRTKTGLEVDFILGDGDVAIEVKIQQKVQADDLKGLISFMEEHKPRKSYVVSLVPRARKMVVKEGSVDILPVETFLKKLWNHEILG